MFDLVAFVLVVFALVILLGPIVVAWNVERCNEETRARGLRKAREQGNFWQESLIRNGWTPPTKKQEPKKEEKW